MTRPRRWTRGSPPNFGQARSTTFDNCSDDHPRLDISEGHIVRLFWRRISQGGWQEVWTMRLGGPLENTGVETDVKANSMTFQMADDLTLLAKSLRSFRYRRPAVGRAAFS